MSIEKPDGLHASPSCKNASSANQRKDDDGTKETEFDRECGRATCRFIDAWRTPFFTLENVWAYRKFDAFGYIIESLKKNGYSFEYWHLNFADYGVAQTRKRLILIAKLGEHRITRPIATHHNPSQDACQMSMFQTTKPWVGWYAAIEDIIDTLPESRFASWQLARLPKELKTMLIAQGKYSDNLVTSQQDDPAFTITANSNQTGVRALLVSNAKTEYSDGTRQCDDPAFTVTGESNGRVKAFIVDCQNAGNPSPDRERGLTIRSSNEPCFTLTSSMGQKRPTRAFTGARVVAMTPRALARFQSFPDDYVLPESKTLAAKIIGNAVPPLVMQRVYEGMLP